MIPDVVIVGAGPAGCVAAIVMARAGARVRLLDRAAFPRDKLCGDTLNPGALTALHRLGLRVADSGLPIEGMLVTGPGGVRVTAHYPGGMQGRAVLRRDLDYALVQAAADAGALMDERVLVQGARLGERAGANGRTRAVDAVIVRNRSGRDECIPSRLVIGADGRESRVARMLALSRSGLRPRRWAVGAYFSGVAGTTSLGEMHVRPDRYIGVAPVPGGLVNACVVSADRDKLREPAALLAETLRTEPELRDRFQSAQMVTRPIMLGPLAVDCPMPGLPGLLLAGDAAGFIDPMTGDGLRFALRGAELAAREGLRLLESGAADGHLRLAAARRKEFASKWRFDRLLRALAGSPGAVRVASCATRVTSWPVRQVIGFAADVNAA